MLQLQSSKQEPSFIRYNHYVDFIRPHVDSAKSLSAVLTKAISGLAVFEPRVGSCACAVRGLGLFFQLRGLQGSHTPCSGPLVPQHTSVRRRGWEGSRARRRPEPPRHSPSTHAHCVPFRDGACRSLHSEIRPPVFCMLSVLIFNAREFGK